MLQTSLLLTKSLNKNRDSNFLFCSVFFVSKGIFLTFVQTTFIRVKSRLLFMILSTKIYLVPLTSFIHVKLRPKF